MLVFLQNSIKRLQMMTNKAGVLDMTESDIVDVDKKLFELFKLGNGTTVEDIMTIFKSFLTCFPEIFCDDNLKRPTFP